MVGRKGRGDSGSGELPDHPLVLTGKPGRPINPRTFVQMSFTGWVLQSPAYGWVKGGQGKFGGCRGVLGPENSPHGGSHSLSRTEPCTGGKPVGGEVRLSRTGTTGAKDSEDVDVFKKLWRQGIPWQSSGWNSAFSLSRAWVQSLVRKLRSHKLRSAAKKKSCGGDQRRQIPKSRRPYIFLKSFCENNKRNQEPWCYKNYSDLPSKLKVQENSSSLNMNNKRYWSHTRYRVDIRKKDNKNQNNVPWRHARKTSPQSRCKLQLNIFKMC